MHEYPKIAPTSQAAVSTRQGSASTGIACVKNRRFDAEMCERCDRQTSKSRLTSEGHWSVVRTVNDIQLHSAYRRRARVSG